VLLKVQRLPFPAASLGVPHEAWLRYRFRCGASIAMLRSERCSGPDRVTGEMRSLMPYCNRCGTDYRLGEGTCRKCGTELPRVVDAESRDLKPPFMLHPPRRRRVLAGLIDLIIAYGCSPTY
jgi:hypothetical protein